MRQPTGDNTLAGYVRQSSADITPTATLRAAPINAEYNKLRDAFAVSSGHKHDGSTGEGGYIPLIGDVDALNKVVIDTSNNRVGVFIEVSSAAVEQLRFQDGAIVPVTTNDIDLGTSSLEFKDLYLDGTAHIDTLDVDINGAVAGTFTIGSTLGVTGTTTLSTANITTGVITSVDINSGAIDNVTIGGTTAGAGTFTTINASGTSTLATVDIGAGAIDGTTIGANSASPATVTNLTATGTSTLSTVDINAGAIDGTTIGASSAAAGSFTTVNTSGQATLATVDINGGNIDGAIIGASATAAITGTTITGSSLVGPLTGNVSGNTAGVHTGNVTGNVTGNITASSGASTLNNLTVNGTLDVTGTTIANVTDPTNAQDAATKNYVDTEVSALVDSSPSALNTLNELAAAINDDASFSTTITNSIATKLPLAGGTMSGAIAMGTSKITGLGNPTANQDASTKAYVDSAALLKVGGTMSGALAMGNNKITGLATPTATTDATTKTYVDGILGSATVAATSATNAATSETNAASSATAASNSASAASTSATNAASSYDQFDDRYLGAKSSAPTVDNDGDALITGALYFNSTTNIMNVYGSGGWQSAGSAVNGTSERNTYTATAGQTVFAATYDSGYVDAFLNGVKLLAGTDFTATNGTSITLASGASVNDVVDIVAYGTFVLADHYTKIAADARYVNVAGDTMTGDLSFGDDDKAIFGAGSDLQIYHDGSNSIIEDTSTGNLQLITNGNAIALKTSDGDAMLSAIKDGDVKLYYNNNQKLATTATGIDVTGTVTSDGLTVDGSGYVYINTNGAGANPSGNKGLFLNWNKSNSLGESTIGFNNQTGLAPYLQFASWDGTNFLRHMRIDDTGDISFYEDTGTTAKFFWDASTERLGIGTAAPIDELDVRGAGAIVQVLDTTTVAQDVGGRINLSGYYTGTSENTYAQVLGKKENGTDANRRGYFAVRTRSVGAGLIERMRIDSNGDVGIGIAAPDTIIHGAKNGGATLTLENTNTTIAANDLIGGIDFKGNDASEDGNEVLAYIRAKATDATPDAYLSFGTLGNAGGVDDTVTEAMRITNTGAVGIGATAPDGNSNLQIQNDSGNALLRLRSSTTGLSGVDFGDSGDIDIGGIRYNNSSNYMYFNTNTSEAMRIDSNGNLLVGTTGTSSDVAGFRVFSSGRINASDSTVPIIASRLSTDGEIIRLAKDGTTVGSIVSRAGVVSSIVLDPRSGGSSLTAGQVGGTQPFIASGNNSGSSEADATVNLGKSTARFKDLYLSGGVYLGGTGAANKLDDYERGTWQVKFFNGATEVSPYRENAEYLKMGDWVWVQGTIEFRTNYPSTSTSQASIKNLPFTISNDLVAFQHGTVKMYNSGTVTTSMFVTPSSFSGTTTLLFHTQGKNSASSWIGGVGCSSISTSVNTAITFNFQYRV